MAVLTHRVRDRKLFILTYKNFNMKQIAISILVLIIGFALGRNSHTELITIYTSDDIYYLSDLKIESESGYTERFNSNTERNLKLEDITARDGGTQATMDYIEWATRMGYIRINQYFDGAVELEWRGPDFGLDGTKDITITIGHWQVECTEDTKIYHRWD